MFKSPLTRGVDAERTGCVKSTLSEVLLWNHLKGKQMRGYDFHRQKPINNYIVDFFKHTPKSPLVRGDLLEGI